MLSKKVKILHLLSSNKFSGAENVVCQIIKMFPEYNMIYCSPEGDIVKSLEKNNINFLPISKMNVVSVKRALKEFKPSIIHAHDAKASVIASFCCKKTPIISHIHCNDAKMQKISIKSLLYNNASKKFAHIFFVSKNSYNCYRFKEKIKNKSSILYNVLDFNSVIEKCNEDANKYNYDVVYVGRLTNVKNPTRLVDIMKKVVQKNNKIKMAIVGDGQLKEEVKNYIKQNNLQKNIDMLGFVSNPYKIIKSAKVMLMTSITEGLPMCALESLILGVPVLSTKTDGLLEILENGKNGWLYNEDEEASEIICNIVSGKLNISENCKNFAKKFNDIKSYKSCIENEYNALL